MTTVTMNPFKREPTTPAKVVSLLVVLSSSAVVFFLHAGSGHLSPVQLGIVILGVVLAIVVALEIDDKETVNRDQIRLRWTLCLLCWAGAGAGWYMTLTGMHVDRANAQVFEQGRLRLPTTIPYTAELNSGAEVTGLISRDDLTCVILGQYGFIDWTRARPAGTVVDTSETQAVNRLSVAPDVQRAVLALKPYRSRDNICPFLNQIHLTSAGGE